MAAKPSGPTPDVEPLRHARREHIENLPRRERASLVGEACRSAIDARRRRGDIDADPDQRNHGRIEIAGLDQNAGCFRAANQDVVRPLQFDLRGDAGWKCIRDRLDARQPRQPATAPAGAPAGSRARTAASPRHFPYWPRSTRAPSGPCRPSGAASRSRAGRARRQRRAAAASSLVEPISSSSSMRGGAVVRGLSAMAFPRIASARRPRRRRAAAPRSAAGRTRAPAPAPPTAPPAP